VKKVRVDGDVVTMEIADELKVGKVSLDRGIVNILTELDFREFGLEEDTSQVDGIRNRITQTLKSQEGKLHEKLCNNSPLRLQELIEQIECSRKEIVREITEVFEGKKDAAEGFVKKFSVCKITIYFEGLLRPGEKSKTLVYERERQKEFGVLIDELLTFLNSLNSRFQDRQDGKKCIILDFETRYEGLRSTKIYEFGELNIELRMNEKEKCLLVPCKKLELATEGFVKANTTETIMMFNSFIGAMERCKDAMPETSYSVRRLLFELYSVIAEQRDLQEARLLLAEELPKKLPLVLYEGLSKLLDHLEGNPSLIDLWLTNLGLIANRLRER